MTPREAGETAFYECEGNNAACLKAAFDAYEAASNLRDMFAGQYLSGNRWTGVTARQLAEDAYTVADEMLAARSKAKEA